MGDIVIIGAGVTGLTCAHRLQEDGHQVVIVAKDFPTPAETADSVADINYTSLWGGAHNRWVPPQSDEEYEQHGFALETFDKMNALQAQYPAAGITFLDGIEYLEEPPAAYQELSAQRASDLSLADFQLLQSEDLPEGVTWGCKYRTWCVNPMVYCAFLLRQIVNRGGVVRKMDVKSPEDIYALPEYEYADMVVNCSGTGFNDPMAFPTRGQTCLVANNINATVTRQNKDGSWTFCVPRNFDGGTVIGGTKEPDNWDPHPSREVREQLLSNFEKTWKMDEEWQVVRDIIGRRPTRKGGMRLELENIAVPGEEGGSEGQFRPVVHAYGLGGRGFELSWGVAERVAQLVGERVES